MTFKKNWFTDMIWAVTAAIIGLNIVGYVKLLMAGNPEMESLRLSGSGFYDLVWLGISALVMGVLILFYFLIRMIAKKIAKPNEEKGETNKIVSRVVEVIFFITILAVSVGYRYVYIANAGSMTLVDDFYYELATIKIDETLPSLSHNASYFYISVLSFVMRFLGNKVIAAVALQFVLQILTIVFLYFGIRRLVGIIPAIVSALVFTVYYSNVRLLFEADAQCLVFLLFSISIFCVAGLFDLFSKDYGSTKLVLRIFFASFFAGACCFLEPYCMIVLLFGVALCFQSSEWYSTKTKLSLFFTFLIASVAVGFVLCTITAMFNDVDLLVILGDWVNALKDVKQIRYSLKFEEQPFLSAIEGIVLVSMAFFTLPGYHVWEKTKEVPFLLLLILGPVPYCTMGFLEYDLFSLWIWSALAGLGMQLMLTSEKKKVIESVLEPMITGEEPKTEPKKEKTEKATKAEKPTKAEKATKAEKPTKAVKKAEKANKKVKKTDEKVAADDVVVAEAVKAAETKKEKPVNVSDEPMEVPIHKDAEPSKEAEDVKDIESSKESDVSIDTEVSKASKDSVAVQVSRMLDAFEEDEIAKDDGEATEIKEEPKKEINYIPNPLPVPKKHVKKVADFKLKTDADDDFDLAIDEDDDFDF